MNNNTTAAKQDRIERQKARGQRNWANMTKEERKDVPRPDYEAIAAKKGTVSAQTRKKRKRSSV